mmetsp:Transcript_35806/g.113850  ORF Transcript_35806/g.113850 Transcript_35806/m.113850 type:complete len:262 (-) Transcript_35806:118-903(-)
MAVPCDAAGAAEAGNAAPGKAACSAGPQASSSSSTSITQPPAANSDSGAAPTPPLSPALAPPGSALQRLGGGVQRSAWGLPTAAGCAGAPMPAPTSMPPPVPATAALGFAALRFGAPATPPWRLRPRLQLLARWPASSGGQHLSSARSRASCRGQKASKPARVSCTARVSAAPKVCSPKRPLASMLSSSMRTCTSTSPASAWAGGNGKSCSSACSLALAKCARTRLVTQPSPKSLRSPTFCGSSLLRAFVTMLWHLRRACP